MHRAILCLVLSANATIVCAADASRQGAGSAVAASEAQVIFAAQAKDRTTPVGTGPEIIGSYLWSGRADGNYKPFFQWELKLSVGQKPLRGLSARVTTLGLDRAVQGQGAWVNEGMHAGGSTPTFALRLNTVQFSAWQLDLRWQGGAATFIGPDKGSLPVLVSPAAGVLAVGVDCMVDDRKKQSEIFGSLWNLGAGPATGVVLNVRLLSDDGGELQKVAWSPRDKLIASGATIPVSIPVKGAPNVGRVGALVTVDKAHAGFAKAKEVEAAFLAVADGQLSGRLRNGLDHDLAKASFTLTLSDAKGKTVFTAPLAAGRLAKDAEWPFQVAAPGLTSWSQVALTVADR